MPISSDPKARKRQIAAVRPHSFKPSREGFRSTKSMRIVLPEDLAAQFERMDRDERTRVVMAGLQSE